MNVASLQRFLFGAPESVQDPTEGLTIRRREHLEQARLLAEVARRTRDPIDALPPGTAAAVCLVLWREAVYFTLSALDARDERPLGLGQLWDAADAQLLREAAGGEALVAAMRQLLVEHTAVDDLAEPPSAAQHAREFVESLLERVAAPEKTRIRRWLRRQRRPVFMLGTPLVLLAGWVAWPHPNLAAKAPYRLSSSERPCKGLYSCGNAFFHTTEEDSPWIEYDLGAPTVLQSIKVLNRSDCCQDRALPMVVELSSDHNQWEEVDRAVSPFATYRASLKGHTARYVRLRVARRSVLHLEAVVIR
jgi:hypothetical protein